MTTRSNYRTAAGRATLGSVALLAAFVIVALQAVGTGYDQWPNLLAILLAVVGSGLRIEAAIAKLDNDTPS
ncbi:hypothetical protein GCM10009676_36460 [Prauserella halophila]|uniref:Uncharacterized protein n=1 Tax=Prauserella halophila TaxID=185641 RepID=A0ABP4H1L1_9PSEU|nr:hypothetical protein [Prauserella halophila]MCP2234199.1 hypothetical protein [Prauserella halophila]